LPLVFIFSGRFILVGKSLILEVMGHTTVKKDALLKLYLETTRAGLLFLISLPDYGLKSIHTMSPLLGI